MTENITINSGSFITVNGSSLPVTSLSFSDIELRFRVGRGNTVRGIGSDVHYTYKHSVMTKVGEIEEETWYALVEYLIERDGEQDLFNRLLKWCEQEVEWLKTKKKIRRYALELHAARIFDDTKWCGYDTFRRMRNDKKN